MNSMKKFLSIMFIAMLLVCAFCLTACSNKLLSETAITVQDGVLKVANPVVNTVCKAFVNGEEQDIDEETYEIKIPENAGDKIDVEVEVYDENGKKIGTISESFDSIPTVEVVKEDGFYKWTDSDAAIKEKYPNDEVKYFYVLNSTIKETSECKLEAPAGISTFRVRAFLVGKQTVFSKFSEEQSYTTLATPIGLQYDDPYLTWGKVDFAGMTPTYNVKVRVAPIDGDEVTYDPVQVKTNAINLAEKFPQVFDDPAKKSRMYISVQAWAEDEKYDESKYCDERLVAVLDPVDGVRFSDGKAVWTANPYADSYIVRAGDGHGTIDKTVTDAECKLDIFAYETISVNVMPNVEGAIVSTSFSKTIAANYLGTTSLKYEDGLFYWNAVTGARGYRFTVEKLHQNEETSEYEVAELIEQDVDGDVFSFYYTFPDECKYNVYLTALAKDSPTHVNGLPSETIEVTRLMSPRTFDLYELLDTKNVKDNPDGTISMKINFQSMGGSDTFYLLSLNGTQIQNGTTGNDFTFSLPAKEEQPFKLEVRACSSNENHISNNKITLSSNKPMTVLLNKLAAPTAMAIDGEDLTWTDDNVWDYENLMPRQKQMYSLYFDGEVPPAFEGNHYALGKYSPHNYTTRVCARGPLADGNSVTYTVGAEAFGSDEKKYPTIYVSSDFSNLFYVTKLATPEAQSIRIIDGGTILTWGAVDGAVGYEVEMNRHVAPSTEENSIEVFLLGDGLIKNNSIKLEGLTYDNKKSTFSLTTYGVSFNIRAIGNHGENVAQGQRITMDSVRTESNVFKKLDTPTGLKVSSENGKSNLSWNQDFSGNVEAYYVYDGSSRIAVTNGNAISLETAKEGEHYYNVMAVGDLITYFASDKAVLDDGDEIPNDTLRRIVKLPTVASTWERYGAGYRWKEATYEVEDKTLAPNQYVVTISLGDDGNVTEYFTPDKKGEDGYYYFEPNFQKYPTPIVSVICMGDNKSTMSSDEFKIFQPTKTLTIPEARNSDGLLIFTMKENEETEELDLYVKINAVNRGNGFVLSSSKIKTETDSDEIKLDKADFVSEVLFKVANRGGYFDEMGVYYFTSDEADATTIRFLDKVNDATIDASLQNEEIQVSWRGLTGAKYKVYYVLQTASGDYINSGTRTLTEGSATSVNFSYSEAHKYVTDYRKETKENGNEYKGNIDMVIYVLAVGDDVSTFSSTEYAVSEVKHFQKTLG